MNNASKKNLFHHTVVIVFFLLFIACNLCCNDWFCSSACAEVSSSGGETTGNHNVILNIAICVVAASIVGLFIRFVRQPLILGYLLAGVLIGPVGLGLIKEHHEIITIAEIGLILLLFMIGMDIDLHKMLNSGKTVLIVGLMQFPICLVSSYLFLYLPGKLGLISFPGSFTQVYIAAAISLSSTMIVVKLLYEKFELDTTPGRITLGILVFQDIWAIILLAVQPSLANPNLLSLARTFGSGGLLVLGTLLLSKFLLPHIFKSAAKAPELMLIISLGWCFLISLIASHPMVGLSMEMGALIAGVSLATFPYNLDVNAKVLSLRDFFITLFFIALGMQIPVPTVGMLFAALAVVLIALAARIIGIFGVLSMTKSGHRNAILPTLNLSQISEFSLVIVSLGIVFGHVSADVLSLIIWVFSILAVFSTYLIVYNHELQGIIIRLLKWLHWDDLAFLAEPLPESHNHPIVILGFHRVASSFIHDVQTARPDLLPRIKVVDFNPSVKQSLDQLGVTSIYGDISHLDTLQHAHIHDAQIVLSTIPDTLLRGTTNQKIIQTIRNLCPHAKIFLTAATPEQTQSYYESGADYVIQPAKCAGTAAYYAMESALRGDLDALKDQEIKKIAERNEVLA